MLAWGLMAGEECLRFRLYPCGKRDTNGVLPEGQGGLPEIAGTENVMPTAVQIALREVMDIRQAADYLGISGDTLYRYASEGFVPAFKLGNRWRFKKSLLDRWMDMQSGVKVQAADVIKPRQKKPAGRAR